MILVAEWGEELLHRGYLQADETPVSDECVSGSWVGGNRFELVQRGDTAGGIGPGRTGCI